MAFCGAKQRRRRRSRARTPRPDAYDAAMFTTVLSRIAGSCVAVMLAAVVTAGQNESHGTVSGVARFEGTPPAPAQLKMAADPVCVREAKETTSESIVVAAGGGLQNVFVYVKDGLGARTYPAPAAAVVLDQRGCRYTPH